jgi:DNA-binding CsgD family transcriptional regulator
LTGALLWVFLQRVKDVHPIFVRMVLEAAARNSVDIRSLLAGLSIRPEGVQAFGGPRYEWSEFAEMVERLAEALGGNEAIAKVGEAQPDLLPELRVLSSAFVSPRALLRFTVLVLAPSAMPMLKNQIDDLPDGRLRVSVELEPGYRECPAYFHASIGGFRAVPRYLGLPPANVAVEALSGRHAVYLIDLPPSRTLLSKARRALPALFPRLLLQFMESDREELAGMFRELRANNRELAEKNAALERELSTRKRLEAALLAVLGRMHSPAFLLDHDTITLANASGQVALEHDRERLAEELKDAIRCGGSPDLEVVASEPAGPVLVVRRGMADEMRRRLALARSRWELSPRQSEVLHCLVTGLTNAEIAEKLGCTSRTVETHLTSLLDRADAPNRLAVVASFWADL